MGLQGYVGSAEDQRRIRRQEKEREDRKKQFEDKKKQSDANVDAAGLRQFGTGTTEVAYIGWLAPNLIHICTLCNSATDS